MSELFYLSGPELKSPDKSCYLLGKRDSTISLAGPIQLLGKNLDSSQTPPGPVVLLVPWGDIFLGLAKCKPSRLPPAISICRRPLHWLLTPVGMCEFSSFPKDSTFCVCPGPPVTLHQPWKLGSCFIPSLVSGSQVPISLSPSCALFSGT